MKEKIYHYLVNRNPQIQKKYKTFRKQAGSNGRKWAWFYLMGLQIRYGVGKRKENDVKISLGNSRNLRYEDVSESIQNKREPVEHLVQKLTQYDVVSFDVFDTLLFRPVDTPSDLFYFMGEELGYLNFTEMRIEIERKARELKYKEKGHREVSLEDIWQLMEEEAGLTQAEGCAVEFAVEEKYCFANLYMLEVLQCLKKKNKRMIAISDMYFSKAQVTALLEKAGFGGFFETVFVSSEYGISKSDGQLYEHVKRSIGENLSYIQVGDNEYADYQQAKKHGFCAYYYPNVNDLGLPYRPIDMSTITGSVYRGVINSYIHNGRAQFSKAYELGFIYGGLFVLGYARWIHTYVRNNNIDQILFLARDGEIIKQVYDVLYPQEQSTYVYWSRLAGTKMCARQNKQDFFKRFLAQKVNQGYSLYRIFESMELLPMLSLYVAENAAYTKESKLNDEIAADVKAYLQKHWDRLLEYYEEQIEAGGRYYRDVLQGCKRVAVVDIGWAGSGAMQLDYLVRHVWKLDCQIQGLLAGTNSLRSTDCFSSEAQMYSGKLSSYLFSQEKNRDIWKWHNPGAGHNILAELLLSSPSPSFRGFRLVDGQIAFVFEEKKEECLAKDIQQGVLDFANYYTKRLGNVSTISGRDAYITSVLALEKHLKIVLRIAGGQSFQVNTE
ncbi:MAG: HAD-IA family hydrolase [Lachnospiraceae bacterium]|nr:HAD-IA family hydrolase [Lachnospiraceae bacterium]